VVRRMGRLGQVVVEMLLILPVFLTIVFSIMELGNMAFWVIVVNHATYEVARIGAMTAIDARGQGPRDVTSDMQTRMNGMVNGARVKSYSEPHSFADRQAGITNSDLVVTTTFPVQLVFPLSSLILSSKAACPQGPGGGKCSIATTVRMPIERPLYQ
jgi:Flp pilus assembly protein TadG